MLAWSEASNCYERALKAHREAQCPTAWWFWIASAITFGAVIFQRKKAKKR
jgi:hypothetical protein